MKKNDFLPTKWMKIIIEINRKWERELTSPVESEWNYWKMNRMSVLKYDMQLIVCGEWIATERGEKISFYLNL
jgi:hypothetical protein